MNQCKNNKLTLLLRKLLEKNVIVTYALQIFYKNKLTLGFCRTSITNMSFYKSYYFFSLDISAFSLRLKSQTEYFFYQTICTTQYTGLINYLYY